MTRFHRRTIILGRVRRGRHGRLALIALGALLLLVGVAVAGPTGDFNSSSGPTNGIVKAGPVDPVDGFPAWYRDATSPTAIDLEGCTTNLDPNCGGAVPVPNPTQPTVFPTNFPDEFFYMDATADLTTGNGGKVLAQFALEGAFATKVQTGDQMTFSRIRFKVVDGLKSNTEYKITHPYGVDFVQSGANAGDAGVTPDLFVTQDTGAAAGVFNGLFAGRVGPFLQWDPAVLPAAPAGYIGDGLTPHKVIGSRNGTNFVRIEGPGIGGSANANPCPTTGTNAWTPPIGATAADCIQTDLFTLVGKKSTKGGVNIARASYDRAAGGATSINVFADSKAGQNIVVRPVSGSTAFPITQLVEQDGRYYARVSTDGTLPATVEVVNRGDIPQTVKTVNVTDVVTGTAQYDNTMHAIHVQAQTSDKSSSAGALSVPPFAATFDSTGAGDITGITAPPDTLRIASTKGGSVSVPVETTGDASPALPLTAIAGADQTVNSGQTVTLDGSNSTGNITGYAWTGVPGVTPQPATKVATFTAPTVTADTDYTITLTISGPGANGATLTATDDLVVHVKTAVGAPVATITTLNSPNAVPKADGSGWTVPQAMPLTLDSSTSTNANTYLWEATPAIAFTSATTPTETFTFPKTTTPVTIKLTVCNKAQTPVCATASKVLTPVLDTLTVARARFSAGGRWVVAGTATSTLQNSVNVYAGTTIPADGTKSASWIGTANVDALGNYQLDVRGSSVPSNTRVSIESARGGVLLNQLVRV